MERLLLFDQMEDELCSPSISALCQIDGNLYQCFLVSGMGVSVEHISES